MKRFLSALCAVCMALCLTGSALAADSAAEDEAAALVQSFLTCNNEQQVEEYISLFVADQRQYMENHVARNGTEDFFQSSNQLLEMEALPYEEGLRAANVSGKELDLYGDDLVMYRTRERITALPGASGITSGEYERVYVMCREDGALKLIRIDTTSITPLQDEEPDAAEDERQTAEEEAQVLEAAQRTAVAPKTGDNSAVIPLLALGAVSLLACGMLAKRIRAR